MDYSTLVGLVGERNRPSGGLKTVHTFCREANISRESKVLEIGSNTGFTAVNIALLTGARVTGVDINPRSVFLAEDYAKAQGVDDLVNFKTMNASELEFDAEMFDAVWASNVPSFTEEKDKMMDECGRVLKLGGFLGVAPIYYFRNPPSELVATVSKLVGSRVGITSLDEWIKIIGRSRADRGFELENCFIERGSYLDQSNRIDAWCAERVRDAEWSGVTEGERAEICSQYVDAMRVFNENLSHCHFAVTVWQKRRFFDEQELFLTMPL